MGPDQLSPDGKWKIEWRVEKDSNSYFESDMRYEILIINVATKKILERFSRSEYGGTNGWDYSGVSSLSFTPDSAAVIVDFEEGETETVPLLADQSD